MKLRDIRKKVGEMRGSDEGKLKADLGAMKREQFNLRFQQATGQMEKASRVRDVRRMVARTKTLLREKTGKSAV